MAVNFPALPPIPKNVDDETRQFLLTVVEILEMMTNARGGENTKAVTKQMLEDSGMDVSVLEEGEPTIVYTYN
ncbi:MAG: hypothetical protein KAS32_08500 [Candidatus Peribacteraceae bacterium]|nr:hypothetical protein [Candidatus Peribacteraceae bacterium]